MEPSHRGQVIRKSLCPLCSGGPPRRLLFSKKGWDYWKCRCGHVFVDPLPSQVETSALYSESYTEEQLEHSRAWFEVLASRRMDLVEEQAPAGSRGRILDAGCGYGFFLREAKLRGWDARGIDFSGWPAEFASREFGLEVIEDDIEAALVRIDDRSVDVLTFWHVLEHLDRPGLILDLAAAKLAPGGRIFLNSPNLDSAVFRLFGPHWSWIYTPGHVQYFSIASLSRAVESRGFGVERAETWTHAPNLYFLLEDSLLHRTCDLLGAVPFSPFRTIERRLRGFAWSTFHHHVLQLRFYRPLYDWTPFLDDTLRRRNLGHEFLLVAVRRNEG